MSDSKTTMIKAESHMDPASPVKGNTIYFSVFLVSSMLLFWESLRTLATYSLDHESCSHIPMIPIVSLYLFYSERGRIFSSARLCLVPGIFTIVAGLGMFAMARRSSFEGSGSNSLSLATFSIVCVWVGAFVLFFGLGAARAAAFPLLFLLLMVPLPDSFLAWIIYRLQQGSTEISYLLFKCVGVPVLKRGFQLSVPSVTIEVATECSGIRSSIALFITCLLAAHVFLRTGWKALLFVLLAFPLAIIKNGIRIVTLTLLSIYVDPRFLRGSLHRDGGFVFFFLALLMLFPIFRYLEKSEHGRQSPSPAI